MGGHNYCPTTNCTDCGEQICRKEEGNAFEQLKTQLAEAHTTIRHLRGKAEFDMPDDMRGKHFNACPDPCDMIDGPCACGAWHNAKEWLGKLNKKLDTAKKENQSFGNVLAVVHRDGGHYITLHGHDKASKDAMKIVTETRTELAEAQEREKNA